MKKQESNSQGISFQAIFSKATTLVDGSWRISFDVNPKDVPELIRLSQLINTHLQIAAIPLEKRNG